MAVSVPELLQDLRAETLPCTENEPLARHTTFRIGGPAALFLECASGAPLGEIVPLVRGAGVPLYVIGRGSNLLVRDEGVRDAVLCTAEMQDRKSVV